MKATFQGYKKVHNIENDTMEDKKIINKELEISPVAGILISLVAILLFCFIKVAQCFDIFNDVNISLKPVTEN